MAVSNSSWFLTWTIWQSRPSASSVDSISSASRLLSSKCNTRNDEFISPSVLSSFVPSMSHTANWRFIEHCPKQAELLDSIHHAFKIDRFNDIGVGPERVAFHQVLLFA